MRPVARFSPARRSLNASRPSRSPTSVTSRSVWDFSAPTPREPSPRSNPLPIVPRRPNSSRPPSGLSVSSPSAIPSPRPSDPRRRDPFSQRASHDSAGMERCHDPKSAVTPRKEILPGQRSGSMIQRSFTSRRFPSPISTASTGPVASAAGRNACGKRRGSFLGDPAAVVFPESPEAPLRKSRSSRLLPSASSRIQRRSSPALGKSRARRGVGLMMIQSLLSVLRWSFGPRLHSTPCASRFPRALKKSLEMPTLSPRCQLVAAIPARIITQPKRSAKIHPITRKKITASAAHAVGVPERAGGWSTSLVIRVSVGLAALIEGGAG